MSRQQVIPGRMQLRWQQLYLVHGWSTTRIAEYCDVNPSLVQRTLIRRGVTLRPRGSRPHRKHADD
jgi:hypothetical protein